MLNGPNQNTQDSQTSYMPSDVLDDFSHERGGKRFVSTDGDAGK